MVQSQDLVELSRQIAPRDLDGVPLYVVWSSELPGELRLDDIVSACTSRQLDLSLQTWLQSVDRWSGRGPAIIVNDLSIEKEVGGVTGGDMEFGRELVDQRLVTYFIHELAHVLDNGIDLEEPCQEVVDFRELQLQWYCSEEPKLPPIPFERHDGRWIRALCHVSHRAEQLLGMRPCWTLLLPSSLYQVSPGWCYFDAIVDELETFDGSFAELLATRPPERFIELWRSDVSEWFKQQVPTTALAATATRFICLFEHGEKTKWQLQRT